MRSKYSKIKAFITKDGSEIRELMHPSAHKVAKQSLAEARVPPGAETLLHRHLQTEEIYHITAGCGVMTLADEQFEVIGGDSICIEPGTAHKIRNSGATTLVILCSCAPAYSDDDTELLETSG